MGRTELEIDGEIVVNQLVSITLGLSKFAVNKKPVIVQGSFRGQGSGYNE